MPVLALEYEIVPRLAQLGLRRDLLLDVVEAAVGGRRNATGFHERILLVEKGGWGAAIPVSDDEEPPAEYEVPVTRKG